jgi:hypothetical protein
VIAARSGGFQLPAKTRAPKFAKRGILRYNLFTQLRRKTAA